jgi:transaldolase
MPAKAGIQSYKNLQEVIMEIWCDSANAKEMMRFIQQGWVTGITTNPKILSAQKISASEQIATLLECQKGPVAVQVSASSTSGMMTQAKKLHAFSSRIIVKIPMIPMGIEAIPPLQALQIPILATAVFAAEQFLLAAKMGVTYVAPYLYHMEQQGIDAKAELIMMQEMIRHYGFTTKVMAASIQDVNVIKEVAALGVGAMTLTPTTLTAWFENPKTIEGTTMLNEAWRDFAPQYAGQLFNQDEK